jgi:hypothetical protein
MSDAKTHVGRIRTEVHGHVFKIIIDNVAKKNSFSPQMMAQISDAITLLDRTRPCGNAFHPPKNYRMGVVHVDVTV